MTAIAISEELLAQLYAHARVAFPAECCGYLVGPRGADRAVAVMACTNAQPGAGHRTPSSVGPEASQRTPETGFSIAGRELFELVRSLDGPRPARVVYHSHTNGRAYFSELDHAFASADGRPVYPVQHLVIGVVATGVTEIAQFGWSDALNRHVELARWNPA